MRGNSQNDKIKRMEFYGVCILSAFTITAGFLTRPSAQESIETVSNIEGIIWTKIKRLPLHQVTLSLHQRINKLLALLQAGICSITISFTAAHLTGHPMISRMTWTNHSTRIQRRLSDWGFRRDHKSKQTPCWISSFLTLLKKWFKALKMPDTTYLT